MTRYVGRRWFLGLGIASVLLLAACSRPHDDAQIASEVRSRISADNQVHSRDLTVQASNGMVTLSGFSDNDPERMAAAADAAQVSGVRTVINDLQVKPQPASTAPAPPQSAPAAVTSASPAQPPAATTGAKPPVVASVTPKPAIASRREAANSSVRRHRKIAAARQRELPAKPPSETSGLPYLTSAGSTSAPSSTASTVPSSKPTVAMSAPPVVPPAPPKTVAVPAAAAVVPAASKITTPKVAAPAPKPVTIPSGTAVSIRLVDKIDSSRSQAGQTFRATLDSPIADESGAVVIPAGQDVTGRIVEAKDAGRLTGKSALALELTQLTVNGRYYTLHTNQFERQGKSEGVSTAKKAGGGAALGALIGAIAGGGKGAAIGAVIGAGAGTGMSGMKKGKPVVLPSETLLSFNLQEPLSVVPSTAVAAAHTEPQSTAAEASAESASPSTSGDDNGPPVLKRRDSGSPPK